MPDDMRGPLPSVIRPLEGYDRAAGAQDALMLVALASPRAGTSVAAALGLLREATAAEPVAEVDPEPFFDFTVMRPEVSLDAEGQRRLHWPECRLYATRAGNGRPLVLLLGSEPHLRWRTFVEALGATADHVGVSHTVVLGAHPGPVPHTRATPLRLYGSDARAESLFGLRSTPPSHEGPTGIATVIGLSERERGRGGSSLMAVTPAYAAIDPNPFAVVALGEALAQSLDVNIDLDAVREAVREVTARLDLAIGQAEPLAAAVREFERAYDHTDQWRTARDVAASRELLAEIERFLGDQRDTSGRGQVSRA